MGTGKSGLYLSTKGSARSVSDYTLAHSNEGTFNKPSGKNDKLRLVSGGHGESNIKLLKKYHIDYNIVKVYENGVRVGNIPNHKLKSKRIGTGQAWFPSSWTQKDIRRAGEHVASLKTNRKEKDGYTMYGNYKGVRVGVKKTHGVISSVFPDSNQKSKTRR